MNIAADREKELLESFEKGDESAISALINEYQPRIYNIACNIVNNTTDAEDIVQEVFLEMYRSLNKFRRESALSTWVFRIAVNKSLDYRKKKFKTEPLSSENILENIPDISLSPLEKLEQKELDEKIDKVMGKLSELCRTVLVLRYHEGLSYKQIAEVLRCSVGTVKSRIHNATVIAGKMLGDLFNKPSRLQNKGGA